MPPMIPGASSGGGLDGNAQGNTSSGPDQQRGQLDAVMGQIRTVQQQVDALGQSLPAMAAEVKQIREALKRMIVKAAQQAPQQTESAQALPG